MMSKKIQELIDQATTTYTSYFDGRGNVTTSYFDKEKFVELLKQAIYDSVKEEIIDDSIIDMESDYLTKAHLRGCNGGIVDALYHIKMFGVEEKENEQTS